MSLSSASGITKEDTHKYEKLTKETRMTVVLTWPRIQNKESNYSRIAVKQSM